MGRGAAAGLAAVLFFGTACYEPVHPAEEILALSLDDLAGVVTGPGEVLVIDRETSFDGNGSLYMRPAGQNEVVLYFVEQLDVENAVLSYRARVKTRNLEGRAFIELRVNIPEKGTFQSTAEPQALSGTSDWVMQEAVFWLDPGQVPSRLYLMLIVDGTGEVWVDDIRVLKTPRQDT